METGFYTRERNAQIVISLLKEHGINKVIASPGATNISMVGSLMNDSFFEIYSAPDERSAAYMACGMAAESVRPFVDDLLGIGFCLVSRLRNDAVLSYLYQGERTGKRGRPKKFDGKIDFNNLDLGRMTEVNIGIKGEKAYEMVAHSKALGRDIKLVVHMLKDGSHRLYFSNDTEMSGIDVFDIYRTRFQIEFCFRDGHQFTGLRDCQARDEKRLDFAFNAHHGGFQLAILVLAFEYVLHSLGIAAGSGFTEDVCAYD